MDDRADTRDKAELEALLKQQAAGSGRKVGRALIILLLLAGAGLGGWYYFAGGSQETTLQYTTEPAERGALIVKVTATGTVQPTTQIDISSELSGIVRSVNVDFNSRVKVGDVLAELDRSKMLASVEAARAKLSVALANVQDAQVALAEKKLAWERKERLARNDIASKQDRDAARAAYDRASAAVVSALANVDMVKAELKLQETNLERTRIVSPINGIVLMRKVDPGQTVASSLQAPVLFTIAEDLTKMEVQVDVDEADVGKVKAGQAAVFTVDAYPAMKFQANIRDVYFGSQVVQGVVTYKGILTTDNTRFLLRPGMTATAEIVVQNIKDALTIPNQALRYAPPARRNNNRGFLRSLLPGRPNFRPPSRQQANGSSRRIWVLREGEAMAVNVVIGASDGKRTQIVKGDIRPGDAVIIDSSRRGS